MGDFPLPRILDFVRNVAPFEALEPEELTSLVESMEIAYFPPGREVMSENGNNQPFLHIIHSGSVKLTTRTEAGGEILVDIRGEGETFGAFNLLKEGKGGLTVTTREDLLSFILPGEVFRRFLDHHPEFIHHFNLPFVEGLNLHTELSGDFPHQITGLEPIGTMALEMRGLTSEIMNRDILDCAEETTVGQAAALMTDRGVGSILVRAEKGSPLGMVTDTDFRKRVLAQGLSPQAPVSLVMSSPPITIGPKATSFEAMLEMTRKRVHHLIVMDKGRVLGIVSDHDISMGAGSSPVGLVRSLERTQSANEIVAISRKIYRVLHLLLRLAVSGEFILDFISEFHDRLVIRLLNLVSEEMRAEGLGRPPCGFAWMAYGGAGRGEPDLPASREYLLVYDATSPVEEQRGKQYFGELGRRVSGLLTRCGFSRPAPMGLPGGPDEPQLLSHVKARFRSWIREPVPETLVNCWDMFDLRAVYQTNDLAGSVWEAIDQGIDRNRPFLRILARSGFDHRPPLGFLREFVVERNGEYTDWLDLRLKGLGPVVRGARVLALDQKLRECGTLARLSGAVRLGLVDQGLAARLRQAMISIVLFRLSRCLQSGAVDAEPEEYVDPESLSKLQKEMLKKSFSAIGEFQETMMNRYGADSSRQEEKG